MLTRASLNATWAQGFTGSFLDFCSARPDATSHRHNDGCSPPTPQPGATPVKESPGAVIVRPERIAVPIPCNDAFEAGGHGGRARTKLAARAANE